MPVQLLYFKAIASVDVGKSQLANMLARKEPGPGYVHLPCGVHGEVAGGWDIEAVAELPAEYRREQNVRSYTVTRWYKRMGRANHRLDCFLYALSALAMSRLKLTNAPCNGPRRRMLARNRRKKSSQSPGAHNRSTSRIPTFGSYRQSSVGGGSKAGCAGAPSISRFSGERFTVSEGHR